MRPRTDTPATPPLMCATAACPYNAAVKVRRRRVLPDKPNPKHVPYGPWLNLCHSCDDRRVHDENADYCQAMGLATPCAQHEWSLQQLGLTLTRAPAYTREPGQDDDQVGL